jgi:protein involved in polysaccharide export with SLBB domain
MLPTPFQSITGQLPRTASLRLWWTIAALAAALLLVPRPAAAQQTALPAAAEAAPTGPIRLRPAVTQGSSPTVVERIVETPPVPYQLDEFEIYVRRLAGQDTVTGEIRRFGADVVTGPQSFAVPDYNALVPQDYVLAAGDELQINLWGSVDADLRVVVDRTGRISLPRVGTVMVAGTRYGDLPELLNRRVAQVFRNFQLSVSLGQLRSVRVYVTGFARRPGAYFVTSLSTIVNALMRAGGPSAAGSFRTIELRRGKETVVSFDLYDLLLKGDKAADRIVQAEDVIHIGAVGPQVGLIGSVNKPAVYELKAGETVQDVLRMAGGFNAVGDRTRLAIERLDERDEVRITQLSYPDAARQALRNGDVLRAFSSVDFSLSVAKQNKRIRIEGEVARPGEYVVPPNSDINSILSLAGGFTTNAFVFGTEFSRESVRISQQDNYERALRDLETEFTRSNTTRRTSTSEDVASVAVRDAGIGRLIERLRAAKPTGRIVLQLQPTARELPNLALEDGDRIYVPPRPTTVGVFGSVFNGGSYLHSDGRNVADFLRQAGGPTRGADAGSTFIVRANGSVLSARQESSLFGLRGGVDRFRAEPGDTIFVPEEMDKSTWSQTLRDWTQIFYQFGLGAAAIKTLGN